MDQLAVMRADVAIVGAGPAGALLALLLVRQGVRVTLLEKHTDFDRAFRGNTLNPATQRLLDRLGLLDAVRALPHVSTSHFTAVTPGGEIRFADFAEWADRAGAPFGEVVMTPQRCFLPLVLDAAARHDGFTLVTGADVHDLVWDENGAGSSPVRGVRYERNGEGHEIRAGLTIACDGRHSRVRTLGGLAVERRPAPIDVLWFHLPKRPSDTLSEGGDVGKEAVIDEVAGAYFRFGPGTMVALMDAGERWQVGLIIAKGALSELKAQGLDAFRARIAATVPDVADQLVTLRSWDETALLSIETSRLRRWYRPGLLCLGDAAHAMSPVGMVGINLAIQDAEATAEHLGPALRAGTVSAADLAAVQRARQQPIRLAQTVQDLVHRLVMRPALRGPKAYRFPAPVRALLTWPPLRRRATHLIAEGRLW
ncbi:MAG: FAD-dependent monooxygenase [Bacteroidota bacterium]